MRPSALGGGGNNDGASAYRSTSGMKKAEPPRPSATLLASLASIFPILRPSRPSGRLSPSEESSFTGSWNSSCKACNSAPQFVPSSDWDDDRAVDGVPVLLLSENESASSSRPSGARPTHTSISTFITPGYALSGPGSSPSDSSSSSSSLELDEDDELALSPISRSPRSAAFFAFWAAFAAFAKNSSYSSRRFISSRSRCAFIKAM
mmetsp:Transcript_6803/g.10936  ORF Transcript_6803/g.10936 Transcript_6803/m.10936 type:complete len:206 (+) Transcript_6803:746-1363(+)